MQKTIIISVGVLAVGILVGWFVAQPSFHPWSGGMMRGSSDLQEPGPENRMDNSNPQQRGMNGMNDSMIITSEREFIEEMVPHHEEAIATAKEVLERGGTIPGMVDLANNIISSQTTEVELMKQSYEEWFGEPYQDTGEYNPMMRELAPYSGVNLDRVFLHDMTMHHMGAIMMSRSVQPHIEHEVMEQLTSNIIVNQSREIETMQQLFAELRN